MKLNNERIKSIKYSNEVIHVLTEVQEADTIDVIHTTWQSMEKEKSLVNDERLAYRLCNVSLSSMLSRISRASEDKLLLFEHIDYIWIMYEIEGFVRINLQTLG